MPELPEVEVIVRGLNKKIRGLTISNIQINFPSIIKGMNPYGIRWFKGKTINKIQRHGKFISIEFVGGHKILMHLCMSGKLLVLPKNGELPKHSHLIFDFENYDNSLIFNDVRRFGKIIYSFAGDYLVDEKLSGLGVDPLEMTEEQFVEIIQSHRKMIKSLLLSQAVISGLGNIYVDESLFDAGIHPMNLSNEIEREQIIKLYHSIQKILLAAIEAGGSTIDSFRNEEGKKGTFQFQHRIYGKYGEKCPKCGNTIIKINVAGRTSSVCTTCQVPPAPRPTARVFRECWWGQ